MQEHHLPVSSSGRSGLQKFETFMTATTTTPGIRYFLKHGVSITCSITPASSSAPSHLLRLLAGSPQHERWVPCINGGEGTGERRAPTTQDRPRLSH